MRNSFFAATILCAATANAAPAPQPPPPGPAIDAIWPDFRGPARDGHAPADARPPTRWSDTDRVKWRTPIPGQGHSSPVVAGGRVWLTTALDDGRSMHAVCVDSADGRVLHDVEVFATSYPGPKHAFNSYASPTPAVGGGRVFVSFGTHGLACLDAGTAKVVWAARDLDLHFETGAGSSPVLYGEMVILECDAVNAQYVVAFDAATGKQAWKTPRSKAFGPTMTNKRRAFSTAVIQPIGGRDVLLSLGAQRMYGYDPATGQELWHVDHGGYSNAARPLYADGLVVFSTGYDKADLVAARVPADPPAPGGKPIDASGDVAWRQKQGAPYKPTPTLVDGRLYVVADTGVARCLDAKTGNVIWTKRLGQTYSASPLYAGGLLYFLSEKGQVDVLKPGGGAEPTVVASFTTDEGYFASPAVVGNALILRTTGHLYRVE
ncbi:MAG: outer rane biosis protein BamB [Phycisphaerales bacterium]|nr:outer rane biosis protein BamB [Phycisphaerales bacterium]